MDSRVISCRHIRTGHFALALVYWLNDEVEKPLEIKLYHITECHYIYAFTTQNDIE